MASSARVAIDRELTRFKDYRGYTVVFTGRRSLHFHLLFSTTDPSVTGAIISFQPLRRAACDDVGLRWDENGNVCDWQPGAPQAENETTPIKTIPFQPLTRADCNRSGSAWDENGNVCDWNPRQPKITKPTPLPLPRVEG
jgi:hypothetical protein